MLGFVLSLCSVIYFSGQPCFGGRPPQKYEDYYFYTSYNGSKVTWMMMPDDNGVVVSAVIAGLAPNQDSSTKNIELHLWTRNNHSNPEIVHYDPDNGVQFNKYDPSKNTYILIHGFTEYVKESDFFKSLSSALLNDSDCNVIGINWIKLTSIPWYGQGVKNSYSVGLATAKIIDDLRQKSTGKQIFHIIAFNLGTLVAGVAGASVTNAKVERITGLDPPRIHTKNLPLSKKLDKDDANLVEIVHTSGDYIGINEPVGHRDFYPNGGKWPQPGCLYDIADRCSPGRAFRYYAEAIRQKGGPFGIKCEDFRLFREGTCHGHDTLHLWNDGSTKVEGKFYYLTNAEKPFWPLQ